MLYCAAPRRENANLRGFAALPAAPLYCFQYVRRAAKDANSSRFSLCGEGGRPATQAAAASLSRSARSRA